MNFMLKGKKRTANFSTPELSQAFIKAASEKWGKDFKAEPVTSGITGIEGPQPENLKTAKTVFKGRYITMATDEYKHLQISATPEGQADARAMAGKPTDSALAELLEEATANGWSWQAPEDLGALTSAPIISDPNGNVYWHERYQVDDPIGMLANGETVQFDFGGNMNEKGPRSRPYGRDEGRGLQLLLSGAGAQGILPRDTA